MTSVFNFTYDLVPATGDAFCFPERICSLELGHIYTNKPRLKMKSRDQKPHRRIRRVSTIKIKPDGGLKKKEVILATGDATQQA